MAEYDLGSIKGIGIKSIEQTSSQGSGADNPITITLDNDTTQTLHVYNGSDGVAYDALGTCSTNAASASTTPTLEVELSNYEGSTIANGFSFNVVFTYGYTYDGQPNMSVNGGTAKPVTVGGVAAGSGAFAAGRAYRFTYTGSNFDCLSNCNLQDLEPYAKTTDLSDYQKGKVGALGFDRSFDALQIDALHSTNNGKIEILYKDENTINCPNDFLIGFKRQIRYDSNNTIVELIEIESFTRFYNRYIAGTWSGWKKSDIKKNVQFGGVKQKDFIANEAALLGSKIKVSKTADYSIGFALHSQNAIPAGTQFYTDIRVIDVTTNAVLAYFENMAIDAIYYNFQALYTKNHNFIANLTANHEYDVQVYINYTGTYSGELWIKEI